MRRRNAAAPAALEALRARAEHDAARALLGWADSAGDPLARTLLLDLHQVFTLRRIREHTTTLLTAGELSADRLVGLTALTEHSISRLAQHAAPLVDAFDLPEALLGHVPIANPDYLDATVATAGPAAPAEDPP